jgi:hypothetical protein
VRCLPSCFAFEDFNETTLFGVQLSRTPHPRAPANAARHRYPHALFARIGIGRRGMALLVWANRSSVDRYRAATNTGMTPPDAPRVLVCSSLEGRGICLSARRSLTGHRGRSICISKLGPRVSRNTRPVKCPVRVPLPVRCVCERAADRLRARLDVRA